MTKDEYIKKMKDLGWPDGHINEQIQIHEEAAKEGIDIPFEVDLIEAPIEY
ncbi:MAG: hypothetical protein RR540_00845 [Oscillospiraceae bacterium]